MRETRRRLVVLAEGCFTSLEAKTAVGLLRYRRDDVVAVIDSTRAGSSAGDCAGVGGATPVVAGLEEASKLGAASLVIGIAPQGGHLPAEWRATVRAALERGWDVISGLHVFLADDPELASLAQRHGARLHDVRRPPVEYRVASGKAADLDALVVLTVGSDCNVGKMTAGLEIQRELVDRSVRAAFVATGQTGILIAGAGVAVDAVPADFVAGITERLVLEAARGQDGTPVDVVLVEGQGALHHPGYSGVTLALMHGSCPRALVLCHDASRERIRITGGTGPGPLIPSLRELRAAYEGAAAWVLSAPVVAVSLNTSSLDEAAARAACTRASGELGVPATDPVRFGAGPLAEAIERRLELRRGALRAREPG